MNESAKTRWTVLIISVLSVVSLIIGVGAIFLSNNFFSHGILPFWYHGIIFALFFLGAFGLIKTYLLKNKN